MFLDTGMQRKIVPLLLRTLLFLSVLLTASSLAFYSRDVFLSDRIMRSGQTVEEFSRALQYAPDNADLWWRRGRLYHYSIERADLAKAVSDYRRALELNPWQAVVWMDLAAALEQTERHEQAEKAVERALEMQPYSPLLRWQAGNFFLRRGNLSGMYDCFATACRYDPSKLGIAIETAWKIDPDKDRILYTLVPDDLRSNLRYLDFLVVRNELDLAQAAWQRCMQNPLPENFRLEPSMLFPFIDRLLSAGRTAEAVKTWEDILSRSQHGLSDARYPEWAKVPNVEKTSNPVWNASFENEILGGGFDWRYPETPEIRFRADARNRLKGLKSLEVTFEGANVASGYLNQIIPIPAPGMYVLAFYFKTEGLTTDQLPYLSVAGFPETSGAYARSECFPPTADWTRFSVSFEVAEGCEAVRLTLGRNRSSRLNNGIRGVLWLDEFSLQPYKPVTVLPF